MRSWARPAAREKRSSDTSRRSTGAEKANRRQSRTPDRPFSVTGSGGRIARRADDRYGRRRGTLPRPEIRMSPLPDSDRVLVVIGRTRHKMVVAELEEAV